MIYYGNEIYHSGVKGQKWGVRNYQNTDGTWTHLGKLRRRKEENYSDDYKKAHDGRSYKTLSTKELEQRNYRLNQENNYRANLDRQKSESIVKKAIRLFTTTAATAASIYAAYKTYCKIGKKAVDKFAPSGKRLSDFTVV